MSVSEFVDGMTYNQQINFLISFYMANNQKLSRPEAFEKATLEWENEITKKCLTQMLELGPVLRS